MSHYKAHIRGCEKGEKFPKIVLGVSVGNQDYEGNKLESIIDYINSLGPCEVIIEVCDTLQRWSDLSLDKEMALKISDQNGDKWLERNKAILAKLKQSPKVKKWDEWRKDPNFNNAFQQVNELYIKNKEFETAISKTAEEVAERFQKRNRAGNKEIFTQNSIQYLLEEIAVIMFLWASDPNHLDLFYPSTITAALDAGHKFFVKNDPEKKRQLNWRAIRITKVAQNDNNMSKEKVIPDNNVKIFNNNNNSPSPSKTRFFASSNPDSMEEDELIEDFIKNLEKVKTLLANKDNNISNSKHMKLRKQLISPDILANIKSIHDLILDETELNNKNSILSC